MTWLPVAERELCVAARKRSTFWLRVSAGLIATAIGLILMSLYATGGAAGGRAGVTLFRMLTWLLFAAALGGGIFFSSDSISEEKRGGTIGFLFLTDLKGYDVVLGKLLATSLRGASSILVAFPVLSVTLLMGGVSAAQFWMTAVAIVTTLFCSACAALFISTLQKEAQAAFSGTILLLFLWSALGPLADWALPVLGHSVRQELFSLTSPVVMFAAAGQERATFWPALFWNFLTCGALFAASCFFVTRTWRTNSRSAEHERVAYRKAYGSANRRYRLRRRYMDPNPVLWLCLRQRRQGLGPWLLGLAVLALFLVVAVSRPVAGVWPVWSSAHGLVAIVLYAWTAFLASKFFVETRRNGFLELILGCGIEANQLVRAQWSALLRTIGIPVAIIFSVQGIVAFIALALNTRSAAQINWLSIFGVAAAVLGIVSNMANLAALSWFGMWMGLTSRSTNAAALRTLLFVQILPWFIISFLSVFGIGLLMIPAGFRGPPAGISVTFPLIIAGVPAALAICKDILFISWSRGRLRSRLRQQVSAEKSGAVVLASMTTRIAPPGRLPPVIQAGA